MPVLLSSNWAMDLNVVNLKAAFIQHFGVTGYIREPFQFANNIDVSSWRLKLERIGTPQEIARAAAHLLSDDGARITGQVLPVDGGHELFENHQVKKLIAAFVCNLLPLNVSLVLENVVTFIFSSMWWFRL